jgi:UDP-N-acetylglucosamine 4-epimerase
VSVGSRTTLNALFSLVRTNLGVNGIDFKEPPIYLGFRAGDVRHSEADIGKAEKLLLYKPTDRLAEGLAKAVPWYLGKKC